MMIGFPFDSICPALYIRILSAAFSILVDARFWFWMFDRILWGLSRWEFLLVRSADFH